MAWRIDESVVRGEIDNRTRGCVTGRIWFAGRDEPIELELAGNAWRDLAGRRLEFINPTPKPGDLARMATRQSGVIGDCTASRKVKVPEVSMDELMELYKQRKPFPWHWGNSLYLEWFSDANGRIVIESTSYRLVVDPEVTWEMNPAEEEAQRRANAEEMGGFMGRLGDAVAGEEEDAAPAELDEQDEAEDDWAGQKPFTEAEAERILNESEQLVERIQARLEREDTDFDKILREELDRQARERRETPLDPEEEAKRARWYEQMNRAAEAVSENPEPNIDAGLVNEHPVLLRATRLAGRLICEPEERGWMPANASSAHPVGEFANSVINAATKLVIALKGCSWPPELHSCAYVVVRVKRARGYLDHAIVAAEFCAQHRLVDLTWLAEVQREITAVGRECDLVIDELRAKLERGFD